MEVLSLVSHISASGEIILYHSLMHAVEVFAGFGSHLSRNFILKRNTQSLPFACISLAGCRVQHM